MTRIYPLGLILALALLGPFSANVRGSTIYANGGDSDGSNSAIWNTGTDTVHMMVWTSADTFFGPLHGTFHMTWTLYTLGPVIPGTLTLNSYGDFDGSQGSAGSGSGTIFQAGSPDFNFNWSITRISGIGNVKLPVNLGKPFSITLNADVTAQKYMGQDSAGNEAILAHVSIAPVPEPATFLLFFSGLTALACRFVRRKL